MYRQSYEDYRRGVLKVGQLCWGWEGAAWAQRLRKLAQARRDLGWKAGADEYDEWAAIVERITAAEERSSKKGLDRAACYIGLVTRPENEPFMRSCAAVGMQPAERSREKAPSMSRPTAR